MPDDGPLIELRGLAKTYQEGDREREVLRRVDARIEPGEFAVLVGRSGSGKSTLLNLISGIDVATAGDVVVDGQVLTQLSEHQRTLFRRRHIGFVFQFFNLIPTLTVEENLLLPLELNGSVGPAEREAAQALLARVGLGDRGASFPDRLSGGEQQRVAVARALVHRPLLLLADEPTGNLDAETGRTVMELLVGLGREAARALFMVTHNLELAALADRVFTIEDGHMVETGGRG